MFNDEERKAYDLMKALERRRVHVTFEFAQEILDDMHNAARERRLGRLLEASDAT